MSDKRISEIGKISTGVSMCVSALNEAAKWADELMESETKSRREKEYVVRNRLAKKLGVSSSYLFRLQYKIQEMNDVKGSVYRALLRARLAYEQAASASARLYQSERERAVVDNPKLVRLADFAAGAGAEKGNPPVRYGRRKTDFPRE